MTVTQDRATTKVWVESLSPLAYYHSIGNGRRTPRPCRIPIVGHGYQISLAEAEANADRPCRCIGG